MSEPKRCPECGGGQKGFYWVTELSGEHRCKSPFHRVIYFRLKRKARP